MDQNIFAVQHQWLADHPVGAVMTPRTSLECLDLFAAPEVIRVSIREATHSCILAADGVIDKIAGGEDSIAPSISRTISGSRARAWRTCTCMSIWCAGFPRR